LIHIPRMYSEEEFVRLSSGVPEDYDERSEEFWSYVEEKLKPLSRQVRRIYLESLDKGGDEGMKAVKAILDGRSLQIVEMLVENGAGLHATEDPVLVLETLSWLEMMENNPDLSVIGEMCQESLKERDNHIAKVIGQTLRDGEIGVIFIEPTHRISFPEDIKIIKMCRFDPSDYLNIWLQKLKLREA
jgi:hypothetical protein